MKYVLPFLFACLITPMFGQQPPEPCGTMPMLEEQLKNDPGLAERMARAEERLQQFIARNKGNRSGADVITIPVVFHIVHNGEPVGTGRNISEAQILSQLEVINEDFQRMNADTVNLRSIFKDVAGNPNIEFCLATVTPEGIPTDGINRINGGRGGWSKTDIENELKPSTVWDSRFYLNFWVVDFESSLIGYAQYASFNKPLTDGIVIGYKYVGRPPHNPFPGSYYQYGRTATHEIGHWSNLLHIWGSDDCDYDDYVDDTPRADDANYGCPTGANSCTEPSPDLPDMVENYMDYTRDACKNTFTKGQVEIMRAAIEVHRPELLNSLGCIDRPTFTFGGKVIDTATGLGVPFAKVLLKGIFTYEVEADSTGEFVLPHPLLEGVYQVFAGGWGYRTAYYPNDTLDAGDTNYIVGLGEGFYDDFSLDYGWTEEGNARTGRWTRGIPLGTLHKGQPINPEVDIQGDFGESCFVTGNGGGEPYNDDVDNGETTLKSPYFDATGYSDPKLAFYRWFQVVGDGGLIADSLIITLTNRLESDTLDVVTRSSDGLGQWIYREYRILEHLAPTDSMQLSIFTSDRSGYDNLLEAGIDMFQVADSLPQIPKPIASFSSDIKTICLGDTVHFTNTSLNLPNTVEWSFTGGIPAATTAFNPIITFNIEGNYSATLIVENAGGIDSVEMPIHVYSRPNVTLTSSPILCHDAGGSITLNITNGTPPIQIQWNTGDTVSFMNYLTEGTYTAVVTDSNGCGEELGRTLIGPPELIGDAIQIVPDSGTGSGEAVARAVGGTPPYTFKWNDANSSTDSVATSLTAGSYTVTITDKNGCQVFKNATISLTEFIDFRAIPNPALHYTQVHFDYSGNDPIQFTAYNLMGQIMYRSELPASRPISFKVSLSGWLSGIYLLEISNGGSREFLPLVKVNK